MKPIRRWTEIIETVQEEDQPAGIKNENGVSVLCAAAAFFPSRLVLQPTGLME